MKRKTTESKSRSRTIRKKINAALDVWEGVRKRVNSNFHFDAALGQWEQDVGSADGQELLTC